MKKFSFLFAALCMALTMSATEVTVTIGDYAAANGWENSVQYTSLTMDEVVTVTANPTTGTNNNTGKYYESGLNWRMYQNEAPAITLSAAEGYILTSVTFTYDSNKTGVMVDADGNQVASAEAYALDNVASVTFSVSNTDATVTNGQARITAIAVSYEAASAIEWIQMDLSIANLTTEVLEVEGAKYLQLMGRDDMNDADVTIFLNNYTGEDKEYEVNAESSYMTFGGIELTVLDGKMTQTEETYTGIVHTYAAEEEMYVEFALTMYSAPATVLELTDAIVAINEELGTLTFNVPTDEGGYYAELAGYTAPGVHEGPQICLFMTPDAVAYTNYAETSVADGIITLKGEFISPMGPKFDVTISGKLPVVEPVEPAEPVYTENNLNTYAFGLESELTEEALNVTYRLNNSNATSVNVLVYEGEVVVATIPGGTSIGKNVVEVATAELPQGVELTWAVEVNGTSVEVPTQESKIYSFYHPSGLDIDNNPENPTFGMLLINEGMQSVASKTEGYVSAQFGAGIFAFTPSLDLIPNGDKPGYNGGIEFTTTRADGAGTAYSPRRIRISDDGRIFVTSLNTDGNYLWEVNPENLNEWTSVFQGTLNENKELVDADSNFVAAPNNGFDVKGAGENLQLAMYSVNLPGITAAAMSGFRLHEYNLGTATEWATAPSKAIVEGKYAINYTGTQVEYDNEGGVWIASYRGTANDANPGLVHINADGVEDAKLIWSNVRQAGIRFNSDFTKLVVAGNNGAAKKATIYAVSKDANGAPVLTEETVIDMAAVGNNLNDFAFDYAGNLYACGNSAEKLIGWAMPYSGQVVTPAASQYAFQLEAVPSVEIVGIVKRAVQLGESTIILTHEDNVAHIYSVTDGVVAEVSQEGVVAIDPENAGDLLAISDIAVTEDGKLVAVNYMICQSAEDYVDDGYKRGENRFYIWEDINGDPAVWFKSNMYANWFRSKQALTMAVKGTSQNADIMVTGIHATKYWSRFAHYTVIDGVYNEPADAVTDNGHHSWCEGPADGSLDENVIGVAYELNASPVADNWILDAELTDPIEFVEPAATKEIIAIWNTLPTDLGKKYNGATILSSEDATVMVAPYADADGKLAGVKILDITNGLAAAEELQVLALEAPVEATAAATAVNVPEDEDAMYIYLVADNTIHTLKAVAEEEEEIDMTIENATTSLEGQNIMLNGMWGESNVTISLWQGGATQGYGIYSGEGEGDYYGMVTNPFMQLFPSGDGVYTDNGNGTWTFKAFMTDGSLYYNVTMNGLTSGSGVEIADYITIDNTNIMKEGVMTNFVGYNDYYEVDLVLFGQEYGEYKVVEEDGETIYPIEGFINEVAFVGEGVYSFSDEYNSDLLVATIYVPADGIYYEVTMYTKQVAATDVLIMENMTKEIIEGRWNTNLQLSGVHEEYGNVVITIAGCDGTYGEYAVTATVGDLELEGYGAWQNDGDVDVLNAMLQNADASRVFNVSVSTPYVEDPEPEIIVVEIENAIFTETEDGLEITGTSLEGQELYLLVGEWATVGYGMYTEFGAVVGTVDGVEVTIMGEDQYAAIEQDEDRAILAAVLTDGTNIYEISAYGAAPGAAQEVEIVGIVKRAVQLGENSIVLTHEADGTAHIYNVAHEIDGDVITEVSQEGVIAVDPENAGDYLAISDIAVTEDEKLVAVNYTRVYNADSSVETGYKQNISRFYIWNDITAAPAEWFTSKMSSNSLRSDQGYTMAVKGTSTNAEIMITGVHNSGRGARLSHYTVIDGVYTDPALNDSEHYHFIGKAFKSDAVYNEGNTGVNFQLNALPGDAQWMMDGELIEPSAFADPLTYNTDPTVLGAIAEGTLGKKYNGVTIHTVDDTTPVMVAPYADAEGKLAGVKVLNLTNGVASATELAVADLEAPVEATAAATAVGSFGNVLTIYLVADNVIYELVATIDPGPGTSVDNISATIAPVKMIKDNQLVIIKNGVMYNAQGAVVK